VAACLLGTSFAQINTEATFFCTVGRASISRRSNGMGSGSGMAKGAAKVGSSLNQVGNWNVGYLLRRPSGDDVIAEMCEPGTATLGRVYVEESDAPVAFETESDCEDYLMYLWCVCHVPMSTTVPTTIPRRVIPTFEPRGGQLSTVSPDALPATQVATILGSGSGRARRGKSGKSPKLACYDPRGKDGKGGTSLHLRTSTRTTVSVSGAVAGLGLVFAAAVLAIKRRTSVTNMATSINVAADPTEQTPILTANDKTIVTIDV
jgi:hypothetical protein